MTKPVRAHCCADNNFKCAQELADAAWSAVLKAGGDGLTAFFASGEAFRGHIFSSSLNEIREVRPKKKARKQ